MRRRPDSGRVQQRLSPPHALPRGLDRRPDFVKRPWPLLLPLVAVAGCAIHQKQRVSACFPAAGRAAAAEQGRASTTLSTLTFNVGGLPGPVKKRRPPRLREIGREL